MRILSIFVKFEDSGKFSAGRVLVCTSPLVIRSIVIKIGTMSKSINSKQTSRKASSVDVKMLISEEVVPLRDLRGSAEEGTAVKRALCASSCRRASSAEGCATPGESVIVALSRRLCVQRVDPQVVMFERWGRVLT